MKPNPTTLRMPENLREDVRQLAGIRAPIVLGAGRDSITEYDTDDRMIGWTIGSVKPPPPTV